VPVQGQGQALVQGQALGPVPVQALVRGQEPVRAQVRQPAREPEPVSCHRYYKQRERASTQGQLLPKIAAFYWMMASIYLLRFA